MSDSRRVRSVPGDARTQPARRRWSRTGWVLLALYGLLILLCVGAALATEDPKGRFVLLQLPLALPIGGLVALGFGDALSRLSWWGAYGVVGLPTALGVYLVGALWDALLRGMRRLWFR